MPSTKSPNLELSSERHHLYSEMWHKL